MLLDFEEQIARFRLNVTGVLHVGCHLAEEAPIYDRLGVPVVWVEANPDLMPKIAAVLRNYPNQTLRIGAAVTDKDDETVTFHITNYDSMSSSVLEFGTHPQFSPNTVFIDHRELPTVTIDTLMETHDQTVVEKINTLVMDIQGAELLALKGATKFLPQIDQIYCEINTDEVYIGCAKVHDLSMYLPDFYLAAQHMVGNQGWGDGLFLRK